MIILKITNFCSNEDKNQYRKENHVTVGCTQIKDKKNTFCFNKKIMKYAVQFCSNILTFKYI